MCCWFRHFFNPPPLLSVPFFSWVAVTPCHCLVRTINSWHRLFSAVHLVKEKKRTYSASCQLNKSASLVRVWVSHSVMIRTFFKSFAICFLTSIWWCHCGQGFSLNCWISNSEEKNENCGKRSVVHPARGFAFALEWNAADAFKANVLHVNKI